jgi:hypothetical protein
LPESPIEHMIYVVNVYFGAAYACVEMGKQSCRSIAGHDRDLEVLIGRPKSTGNDVREDEALEGHIRVYVGDPFGNRIALMEPTG